MIGVFFLIAIIYAQCHFVVYITVEILAKKSKISHLTRSLFSGVFSSCVFRVSRHMAQLLEEIAWKSTVSS